MGGHVLGLLQIPAIGQVNRDPGRSEGVATDLGFDASGFGAPSDHVEGTPPVKRPFGEHARLPVGCPEQKPLRSSVMPAAKGSSPNTPRAYGGPASRGVCRPSRGA